MAERASPSAFVATRIRDSMLRSAVWMARAETRLPFARVGVQELHDDGNGQVRLGVSDPLLDLFGRGTITCELEGDRGGVEVLDVVVTVHLHALGGVERLDLVASERGEERVEDRDGAVIVQPWCR